MSALSLLCDVKALFYFLHSSSPQSPMHHNNFRFKYSYSLSESDPVSAKLFSEALAGLLEYLMSPLGYENRTFCVCLSDSGNTTHTVWDNLSMVTTKKTVIQRGQVKKFKLKLN